MKIIKTIGIGILVFTLFYLVCAFYSRTFDTLLWNERTMFACSFLGGGISALCMAYYVLMYEKENN